MQRVIALVVLFGIASTFAASSYSITNPNNAPDLPGFTRNPINIPAGSLIIPMDTANQVIVPGTGQLSLLPYGLVVRTLHANISVWWAIQTGKGLNGVDFVANTDTSTFGAITANPNSPPTASTFFTTNGGLTSYSGGPFVILQKDAQKAFNVWNQWGANPSTFYPTVDSKVYSSVHIHELQSNTVMDIRHQIYSHPVIAVSNLDGNAPTQTAMLGCIYQNISGRSCPREDGYGWGDIFGNGAAGCKAFQPRDHAGLDWNIHYKTYDCGSQVSALTAATCLTSFSEPHWEWTTNGPSYVAAMKLFIASGANLLLQCASQQSYENQAGNSGPGTFLTDFGLVPVNPSDGIQPPTTFTEFPDLPVSQFIGQMSSIITGAVPDFYNLFSQPSDTPPSGWNNQGGAGPHAGAYNNFKTLAFPLVSDIYDSSSNFNGRNVYVAAGVKYNAQNRIGSNIWFLTGHTWVGESSAGTENGRRFFFNAMLVPAFRPPACGFSFCEINDTCAAQDACHSCTCNPSGTGFIQTAISPCCLVNADCPGSCQECNTVTHQCQQTTGCCSSTIPCGACQDCGPSNVCVPRQGCCTTNTQCGNSPCLVCTNNQCISTTGCCDPPQFDPCSSQICQTCDTTTNQCTRKSNLLTCCLATSECKDPCLSCDLGSNQCLAVPGCCHNNTDCGSDPCIICVNNTCYNKPDCCKISAQCGGCQICNTSNKCAPNPDPNCCTIDDECGSCRRCAQGFNGTKTCVEISQCCLTQADCEACQNCTNSQCTPIEECCRFDTDCPGCEVCLEFNCYVEPLLSCCQSDDECYQAAKAQNVTNDCDWTCSNLTKKAGQFNSTGICQVVCSSDRNWTGLIVGLAAGVPLGVLFLLALAALIAFLIYRYKDWLNNVLFANNDLGGSGVNNSAAFVDPIQTGAGPQV